MFSVNTRVNSTKANACGNHFEALESRQLMSASLTHAIAAEVAPVPVQEELHVQATAAFEFASLPGPVKTPVKVEPIPISRTWSLPPLFEEPGVNSNVTGWTNVSSDPLFAPGGPSANDITQGQVGDCWFVAALAETALRDPSLIEKDIVQLANGTYDVTFHTSATSTLVENVDGQLPVNSWGGLEYAQLGQDNCTWVPIMEKALTYFRNRSIPANYATLNEGSGSEALTDLGATKVTELLSGVSNAGQLFSDVAAAISSNEAVDICTNGSAGPLVNGHCYSVVATRIVDTTLNLFGVTLTIPMGEIEFRNPWGNNPGFVANANGYGATNNGYVWLSASSVLPELDELVTATV